MKMNTTQIVRRMDDLGRVVIPREIRKNLQFNEGDLLEIYTGISDDGTPMIGFVNCQKSANEEIESLLKRVELLLDNQCEFTLSAELGALRGKVMRELDQVWDDEEEEIEDCSPLAAGMIKAYKKMSEKKEG